MNQQTQKTTDTTDTTDIKFNIIDLTERDYANNSREPRDSKGSVSSNIPKVRRTKKVQSIYNQYKNFLIDFELKENTLKESILRLEDELKELRRIKTEYGIKQDEEYNLVIKGFSSDRDIKEFIEWYHILGEKSSNLWFKNRINEEGINYERFPVHIDTFKEENEHRRTMILNPI